MDMFLKVIGVHGDHHEVVVNATTPDENGDPNWMAVMEVCDLSNLNATNIKEILKDLKKRVAEKDEKTQYLAMLLLESLFKNGGKTLHQHVAHNEDMIKQIGKIAVNSGEAGEQGKKLVLALHLFSHGRKDLKPLQKIATEEELAEYRKQVITEDWRLVAGPGSQGVRADPKSYQEISPRAPAETHVHREANRRASGDQPLRARIDPATLSPRRTKVPPEIQTLWDKVNTLRDMLMAAERDNDVVEGDEVHKLADDMLKSRNAVNKAANASTTSTVLTQLLELNDAMNTVIGSYQRMYGRAASNSSIDNDEFKDAVPCASDTDNNSPTSSVPRLDIEQVLGQPAPPTTTTENPKEEEEEYEFTPVGGGGINDDVPEDQL